MFQYALYLNILKSRNDFLVDTNGYWNCHNKWLHNGYELNRIFGVNPQSVSKEEVTSRIGDGNIVSRIKRKLNIYQHMFRKVGPINAITYDKAWVDNIRKVEDAYVIIFGQSEQYFKDIEDEVRDTFSFPELCDDKNVKILNKIRTTESVSIHVRRGDYLHDKDLGRICDINYLNNAVEKIESYVIHPTYFVFSDDIEWCKHNFKNKKVEYVSCNYGKESYKDMQLMSKCKYNIISNSTFSWWGAWLNENKNKIVIAPDKWFNGINGTKDIIPKQWEKIRIE